MSLMNLRSALCGHKQGKTGTYPSSADEALPQLLSHLVIKFDEVELIYSPRVSTKVPGGRLLDGCRYRIYGVGDDEHIERL